MSNEKSFNILIVDDESQIASILAKYLAFYKGFKNVVIASDGVQAMQKLANQDFDLLITDLVMPKRDGFMLIENIRKIPKYYRMKIMIVSGCLNRDLTIMAMRKGIRQIIVKPFTARQVLEKTVEILKVDKNPTVFVDRILLKVAQQLAGTEDDKGGGLSESEISELIDAYRATKN